VNLYRPWSIYVHVIDQSTGSDYVGTVTVTISSARGTEKFITTNGYVPITASDTLAGEHVVPIDGGYSISVDTPGFRHGELTNLTVPSDYVHGLLSSTFNVTLATVPVPQDATVIVKARHIRHSHDDCMSGTALSGASITIIGDQTPPYSQTHNTDTTGQWTFSDTPLGIYNINASYKDGSRTRTGGLTGQSVSVKDNIYTFCVPLVW
jgi:hypothetical protein